MEWRSGLRCLLLMCALNKSFASVYTIACWLLAARNSDGMFSQSCLHFPMAQDALKQLSPLRGAVNASHPWYCHSRNVIPREALCGTREFSPARLEGGPESAQNSHRHTSHRPFTHVDQANFFCKGSYSKSLGFCGLYSLLQLRSSAFVA